MRIIAGQFRGHGLISPDGHETRPSTGRTRESLFSLVDARMYLEGAEVLDLFAGTGALGLEAISRGAALVTFVEEDPKVLDLARRNAEKLGVEDRCIFIPGDAVEYLRRYSGPDLDLIMADPPYKLEAMRELPDLAIPHLTEDGVLTLEHSTHDWFDEHPHLMTSRQYGRTVVSLFRPPLPPAEGEEPEAEPDEGWNEYEAPAAPPEDVAATVEGAAQEETDTPHAPAPASTTASDSTSGDAAPSNDAAPTTDGAPSNEGAPSNDGAPSNASADPAPPNRRLSNDRSTDESE
jgi:16S rRNA (guanine966-N2)-methyltransferase